MEISIEDLNVIAYQFMLFGRSFKHTKTGLEWHFLPPIGEKLGTGKVTIKRHGESAEIKDFNVIAKDGVYYLQVNFEDFKILGFHFQTYSAPTTLTLQDSSFQQVLFEELK